MDRENAKKIIKFLHQSEKLKTLMRHSWLSSGRREDVAEHSWRMALMAIVMHPELEKKVDLLKSLKMVLVHDLVEIYYQDNPAHKGQPADKEIQERKALKMLTKLLPTQTGNEINDLWNEYEAAKSPEARFAKSLDKTEVLLQHNEADIKHLHPKEVPLYFYYGKEFSQNDKFLKLFREIIEEESLAHLKNNDIDKKLYQDYI